MKPNPKAQTLTQKNQTGPIKSMTHNQATPSKLQRQESNPAPLAHWAWNIPLD